MAQSPHEQALLAHRWISTANDRVWVDFPRYWMAFNALYRVVRRPGNTESQAVGAVIRRFFGKDDAQKCLDLLDEQIRDLVRLPPGDDRLDPDDPKYRKKATSLAEAVRGGEDPVQRLSSLMEIVYQVRCNLLHGSKDPAVIRDQDLIRYCTPILEVVVPTLQRFMEACHDLSA